jgi:D-alanyl-D-alanine carboxypeptidase
LNTVDSFKQKVAKLHQALGISPGYLESCKLPWCPEPDQLVETEPDFYQRPQQLTQSAFKAWTALKTAAEEQAISLFLISAFRSVQYQHDLLATKLKNGQPIEQILRVNAAPGFSEHHTGRAIDVGTSGCDALVTEFENTKAFQWLTENAGEYGFSISYPRDNCFGIDYEPWHWCFHLD